MVLTKIALLIGNYTINRPFFNLLNSAQLRAVRYAGALHGLLPGFDRWHVPWRGGVHLLWESIARPVVHLLLLGRGHERR